MKEYKINDYITLKLEGKSTVIYIKNSRFIQCKKLVLDVPIADTPSLETAESIDEVAKRLKKSKGRRTNIPPEDEFWGHCSNIQAWVESNYNTDLLHTSLSFPLLRKLVEKGDSIAKEVFKEEILHRLINGEDTAIIFLLDKDYLEYFTKEEISTIYKENISKFESSKLSLAFLRALVIQKIPEVKHRFKELVKDHLFHKIKALNGGPSYFCHFLAALEKEELIDVFEQYKLLPETKESDKFHVLDDFMGDLQFLYSGSINFGLPEVAKILLVKSEQRPFLDIVKASNYPYIQENFASDEVRRRHWQNKLYFFMFRGHIDSIELVLDLFSKKKFYRNLRRLRSFKRVNLRNALVNERLFYENLSRLKNFTKLEQVNLLCWSKYDTNLVKQRLSEIKSLTLVQIYEFFKDPPNFIQLSADEIMDFVDADDYTIDND